MLSFLAKHPTHTRNAHNNPVIFDDGRSSIEFKSPSDSYLVINRWPPAASDAEVASEKVPNKANCALAPPLHWHILQKETFHVLEGKAEFTLDGRELTATAGDVVTIPARAFHTFRNASEEEGLVIEFSLAPSTRERDEAFFRNVQGYRDDCRKAGMQRRLPQVLLFNWRANVVLALPGPKLLAKVMGLLMNFVGGLLIGKWILGYSDTYPEYYHKASL
ncbi:hypothetical protein NA57DRAFT_59739 [Rhizodiscina lignyota]|uniref:Cupin type-2 domain-containing protein n=1 Tax=Rhizodiscina lignyota TaxID=1504668 RepID=A0A9P4IBZ8_9PEZI|nr:hypothetical protein NA57DRAFT_59739 [Rhizodiscina lignyota]